MRKLLLKNSLKYFWSSKLTVILTSIIVFLASLTFSSLTSLANNMQTTISYLNKDGNLQDFSIAEKYRTSANDLNLTHEIIDTDDKTYSIHFAPTRSSAYADLSFDGETISIPYSFWRSSNFLRITNFNDDYDGLRIELVAQPDNLERFDIRKSFLKFSLFNQDELLLIIEDSASIFDFEDQIVLIDNGINTFEFNMFQLQKNIISLFIDLKPVLIVDVLITPAPITDPSNPLFQVVQFIDPVFFKKYEINNTFSPILNSPPTSGSWSSYDSSSDLIDILKDARNWNVAFGQVRDIHRRKFEEYNRQAFVDYLKENEVWTSSVKEFSYIESVSMTSNSSGNNYKFVTNDGAVNSVVLKNGSVFNDSIDFLDPNSMATKELYDSAYQKLGFKTFDFDEEITIDGLRVGLTPHDIFTTLNSFFASKSRKHKIVYDTPIAVNGVNFISIVDPTSYEGVVSTQYAENNNLRPVSRSDLYSSNGEENVYFNKFGVINETKFKTDFPNSFVEVDGIFYAVVGTGVSPDFAYPIIDTTNIAVNTSKQAVVYVNSSGYSRIKESFANNLTENYFSVKILDEIKNKDRVIAEISSLVKPYMTWPSNLSPVVLNSDANAFLNLSPTRISTLQQLADSIETIALIFSILLFIISAFIVFLIVKRKVVSSLRTLGILQANGYKKVDIALSYSSIAILVGIAPPLLGYMVGFSLQFILFSIFSNIWTLDFVSASFSPLPLLASVLVPSVGIFCIAFLTTIWVLRKRVIDNINSVDKTSAIGNWLSKMLYWVSIQNRFSLSLFTTNVFKMVWTSLAIAASTASLTVSFANLNKFIDAYNRTEKINSYAYKLNLYTPTNQGGQYSALYLTPINSSSSSTPNLLLNSANNYGGYIGYDLIEAEKSDGSSINVSANLIDRNKPDLDYNSLNKIWQKSYYYTPRLPSSDLNHDSGDDPLAVTSSENNPHFLNHKVLYKPLLDIDIGFGSQLFNPWKMSTALMPENFQRLSEISKNEAIFKTKSSNIAQLLSTQPGRFTYFHDDNKPNTKTQFDPYLISYNQISINHGDELYSYASGKIVDEIRNISINRDYLVTGIKRNSNFIRLNTSQYELLDSLVVKDVFVDTIPVLITRYMKDKTDLDVGSSFKMNLQNSMSRYEVGFVNPQINYQVVGVVDAFKGEDFITHQKYVNQMLAWKPELNQISFEKVISNNGAEPFESGGEIYNESSFFADYGARSKTNIYNFDLGTSEDFIFNGVFTKNISSRAIKNLSLYSPTGLYISSDRLPSDYNDSSVFRNAYTQSVVDRLVKSMGGNPNSQNSLIQVREQFTENVYQTLIGPNVDISYLTQYSFQTSANFISILVWAILVVSLLITIIFVTVITINTLEENRRNMSVLKVQGYRNKEISWMFTKAYLPSVIVGILLAIPLALAMIRAVKYLVIRFGDITVPLEEVSWEFVIASVVTVLIFSGIFIAKLRVLKSTSALEALK